MKKQARIFRVCWCLVAAAVGIVCVGISGLAVQEKPNALALDLRRALERQLEVQVDAFDGVMGYSALDLTSGENIGRLDQQEFPTASTIKLAVMYELFRQADEGRLKLDEPVPLDRRAVVGGSGLLHAMGTPALSLRDHAVLMMSISDNTATNVIIERVGIPSVTGRMQGLGLSGIRLRRKMQDAAAAARGDENAATPRDITRLLKVLHAGEGLKPESRAGALKILEIGAGGQIRRGVPARVEVLNKTGSLEGVRVDAAIVRAKNRPYALTVMTTFLKEDAEGERAITEVSRAFYQYFARLGAGSEYGRQLKREP